MSNNLPPWHQITAHHEASHAVTAVKLGVAFDYVAMIVYQYTATLGDDVGGLHFAQDFDTMLRARNPASPADRLQIENLAIVAFAGEAGQAFLEKRECDVRLASARGDYEIVVKLANWLFTNAANRDAFIARQTLAAWEMVRDPVCDRQIECVAIQL
jgi:hypothetical protein